MLPVFLLLILGGAIVLGPLLYFGLEVVWPIPFHRAMDRGLLISAVAVVLLFGPGIPWRDLWPLDGPGWKHVLVGLVLAAVTVQALLGFDLALAGFSSSHPGAGKAVARVLLAILAALMAAPVEETIFRGFLQTELSRSLGWRAGWILAAAIFMLAHFLKIPVELDRGPVHLWSGASALAAAFAQAGHDLVVRENQLKASNLFVLGLVLGGLFLRAVQLWTNAGLHAGLIFALLLFTGFARQDDPPHVAHFGGDILSNPVTTVVFLLLGAWIWRFYRHPSNVPGSGASAR